VTSAGISTSLVRLEGIRLAQLVGEFRDLLASADARDEALNRLTPNPYPDDANAAREFADGTRTDLLDRRGADALTVHKALAEFRIDGDEISEEEALRVQDLVVAPQDVDAWLRTLNAIRLVIASRLEIDGEDDHDPDDPRYGVYDWLGYRLELLIQAAEDAETR
jgi:hypothetical protein